MCSLKTYETIVEPNKDVYLKLNEGLGGAYERVAYTNVMKRLMETYDAKSILELNATYIAGVPGFNSVIFAQAGYDVTITVRPRDFEDAKKAWELVGLQDNVKIIELTTDIETPLENNSFDIVYNHLAFDQYKDPLPLVKEMKRLARMIVMNLTLTPYNYGFLIHRLSHLIKGKPYDHGYAKNALIPTLKRVHKEAGLEPMEWGGVDCPPWMDTVDEHFGGSMTYIDHYPKGVRDKWVWCSANPECRDSWLVKMLWYWERNMPGWFKILTSHHLYLASLKLGR